MNKSPAHTTTADTGCSAVITLDHLAREEAEQPRMADAPGVLMCARAHNWLDELVGLDCSVHRVEELRGRMAGIADAIKEGRGDKSTHANNREAGGSQQAEGRGQYTHSEPLARVKAEDEVTDGVQAFSNDGKNPAAEFTKATKAHGSLLDVGWLLDLLPPVEDDGAHMWLNEPQDQEEEGDVGEGHGSGLRDFSSSWHQNKAMPKRGITLVPFGAFLTAVEPMAYRCHVAIAGPRGEFACIRDICLNECDLYRVTFKGAHEKFNRDARIANVICITDDITDQELVASAQVLKHDVPRPLAHAREFDCQCNAALCALLDKVTVSDKNAVGVRHLGCFAFCFIANIGGSGAFNRPADHLVKVKALKPFRFVANLRRSYAFSDQRRLCCAHIAGTFNNARVLDGDANTGEPPCVIGYSLACNRSPSHFDKPRRKQDDVELTLIGDAHGSDLRFRLLLDLLAVQAEDGRGKVLASNSRQYAVFDARRKFIRPLVYRLVGDAYSFGGSGDGPAKKFDGFGFKHEPLNHSSGHASTMVQRFAIRICNHG